MKRRVVVYAPEARTDLKTLYDDVADAASEDLALAYLSRIRAYIDSFDMASERGTSRDDLRSGLRVIGFRRRVTIWFKVADSEVRILRVFRASQDWSSDL